jgi:aldose 1-epimerase
MSVLATRLLAVLALIAARPVAAHPYAARVRDGVVTLEDMGSRTTVSILPSVGNIAFEMNVNGSNVLWWPYRSVEEFKARPTLSAIPFLGPWANRLDEQAFYANGRKYAFDMELGNVRGAIPIHGFLTTAGSWQVVETRADARSAWATSRLDFYKQPSWMKQFPFAHTIAITHRLQSGMLQVTTRIQNLSAEPMPVGVGFHPYLHLTDSPRDDWTISIGARKRWLLASTKVPTGETAPVERLFPDPSNIALRDYDLDDVFSDLVRDASGRAAMSVKGKAQQVDVLMGPTWRAAVVYAPRPNAAVPDRQFICFEPMAGITDAMNLANKGLYNELQSIAPGATWEASFWIRARGF